MVQTLVANGETIASTSSSEPAAGVGQQDAAAPMEADSTDSNSTRKLPRVDGTYPRMQSVDFPDTDTDCETAEDADCVVDLAELEMRDAILKMHATPDDIEGAPCVLRSAADAVARHAMP